MKIAILGFGTVGSGVKQILDDPLTTHTKDINVAHVFVRKGKEKTHPLMCDDIETILTDATCDVVVESLGGLEPAHTFILQSLQAGKHVVTANKAVVAAHLKEFTKTAKKHGVKFYYEATTGGGIPWIEGLSKAMRIDEIDRIHGIFNGTSNYILDHMQRFSSDFQEVLQTAQQLGYAEADPSADIDGEDIRNKLRISASLAYHSHIPANFPVFGIRNITQHDVSYFKTLGYAVRLIAKSRRSMDHYGCVVEPVLFPIESLESNTQDNFNLISLHGASIGDLKFFGQGAGKLATANAILQDIIDIKEGVQHIDTTFDRVMQYDKTLCLRDYILRVHKDAYAYLDSCTYEETQFSGISYLHIKDIAVNQMHIYMQQLIKIDKHAFMASIQQREEV